MQIPGFSKYDVTEDGIVTLISTGEILEQYPSKKYFSRGTPCVQIRTDGFKPRWMPVSRCILMAFRPQPDSRQYPWLSVKFLDGDNTHVSLTNLEWDRTIYVPEKIPGYNCKPDTPCPIYGIPGFHITVDGIVSNDRTGHRYRWYRAAGVGNYPIVNITGVLRMQLARLLALTFLKHPVDTSMLVVNHIDGNTDNFEIYNLEWATYSENINHAYSAGLRSECVRILAKHIQTGEERSFASINEAARFFGVNPGGVHWQLNDSKSPAFHGFYVKFASDPRSWEELSKITISKDPVNVSAMRISTREVKDFASKTAAARELNIPLTSIGRLLKSEIPAVYGDWYISSGKSKEVRWPTYDIEMLDLIRRMRNTAKPIRCSGPDGTHLYSGVTEWVEKHPGEIDPAALSRKLQNTNRHKDWVFEYINPEDYAYE